ncbi:MAG: antibiotic biosynthesis monooxygenase [Spirochaetota bacterium]
MVVTTVMVKVKDEHIQDFIRETTKNHEASIKEPGNMRFDILQSRDDPSSFLMYEAYESDESAAAHKETEHYKVWREAVEPWMAKPREGIKYIAIRPV